MQLPAQQNGANVSLYSSSIAAQAGTELVLRSHFEQAVQNIAREIWPNGKPEINPNYKFNGTAARNAHESSDSTASTKLSVSAGKKTRRKPSPAVSDEKRLAQLKTHRKKILRAPDLDWPLIVRMTEGFNIYDVQMVIDQA